MQPGDCTDRGRVDASHSRQNHLRRADGVDRAGLDAAMEVGIPVGGFCPKGRRFSG
nr:putative molybdenum carrier protein [Geobacter sp.]